MANNGIAQIPGEYIGIGTQSMPDGETAQSDEWRQVMVTMAWDGWQIAI
jgi:hypothetical protein